MLERVLAGLACRQTGLSAPDLSSVVAHYPLARSPFKAPALRSLTA